MQIVCITCVMMIKATEILLMKSREKRSIILAKHKPWFIAIQILIPFQYKARLWRDHTLTQLFTHFVFSCNLPFKTLFKYSYLIHLVARFRYNLEEFNKAIAEYRSKTCIRFAEVGVTGQYHIRMMNGNGYNMKTAKNYNLSNS